jgi:molybdenum cofactor cytidylyltransferase
VGQAEAGILAHAVFAGATRFRKGHRLTADDLVQLEAAGVEEVVAAILEPGDLDEDQAARRVAHALKVRSAHIKPASTGRVNLHAAAAGIFTVDKALIDALNRIDPAVTIATVAAFARVAEGQMVATVKIIPFAVPGTAVAEVEKLCAGGEAFAVNTFTRHRVGLIQTILPGIKESVLDKTARVTEARLARSGSRFLPERRTPHAAEDVAAAIMDLLPRADLILAFGASAMSDADDVIPAAIRAAGGAVERVGMPVDPGNLIVLGNVGGKAVLGAPGCARSPKENGFDWVLDRLLAGLKVVGEDIAGMGVGGLLMEIPTRPQPRDPIRQTNGPNVHAVVLAAGRSSRMGGPNKLLAVFGGEPLVRLTAKKAAASKVCGVTVVTGHQGPRIREALRGTEVSFADNPDFSSGLSSSLKVGIAAVPPEAAGALVVLGDMPGVATADLDRLIEVFMTAGGGSIVRATHNGKRGNPVILPRALFCEIALLQGDAGARHIVEASKGDVIEVEIGAGASVDVDTPEALVGAGGMVVE